MRTCGQELPDDAVFCYKCGARLGNIASSAGSNPYKRLELMLEDGDFDEVIQRCNSLLDSNPTDGKLYFYLLLASLQCNKFSDLSFQKKPFDEHPYYLKAVKYGDEEIRENLDIYLETARVRVEERRNSFEVGKVIGFGQKNGSKIGWKILKKSEGNLLIISCRCICRLPYYSCPERGLTWSASEIRAWLNRDFLLGYFSESERARILKTKRETQKNDRHDVWGGPPTIEKVFLLSADETISWLGIFESDKKADGWWWLRTPGAVSVRAAYVNYDGRLRYEGEPTEEGGIRPAMWINID